VAELPFREVRRFEGVEEVGIQRNNADDLSFSSRGCFRGKNQKTLGLTMEERIPDPCSPVVVARSFPSSSTRRQRTKYVKPDFLEKSSLKAALRPGRKIRESRPSSGGRAGRTAQRRPCRKRDSLEGRKAACRPKNPKASGCPGRMATFQKFMRPISFSRPFTRS